MKVDLNADWKLTHHPLNIGVAEALSVLDQEEGWLEATLPCDIRQPLLREGLIAEPLEGLRCFESEWLEERSWWFKKEFVLDSGQGDADSIEIVFESLDLIADIFMNGELLGHHGNAHVPFTAELKDRARQGTNTILVRLTSGAETIPREKVVDLGRSVSKTEGRGDDRRVYLRKPQYVYGWDWGPRVVTCGIMKDVFLRIHKNVACRDVSVLTEAIDKETGKAELSVQAEIEFLDPFKTGEALIEWQILWDDCPVFRLEKEVLLRSGLNYFTLKAGIEEARLWWPNGMGEHPLYTARVTVRHDGNLHRFEDCLFGIRTLELCLDPVETGRLFAFTVNGEKVFAKGANWIPADSIYARVRDETYERLIEEAAEANFSMLRIWGGGIYEKDIFYELCDRMGILVWQDFMFACALYPDRDPSFREEVRKEIEYQTKRLRKFPCLALFCGNNENQWIFNNEWIHRYDFDSFGGRFIYDRLAPEIVERNCSFIPYWNSSPYGGEEANSNEVGDRHHWHDCMMNPDMEKRITPSEYDKIRSKFISEYGYIGPCSMKTIEGYHGGVPVDRSSEIWAWHNNTFEKETVLAGIQKHYADSHDLSLEEYILYAGLTQALMLGYSLESIRFKQDCFGSLFWMFNDCWGEVGWSIIDYSLERKPSFYAVKRAFDPEKIILRPMGRDIGILLANDTAQALDFTAERGFLSLDGKIRDTEPVRLSAAPFSRSLVKIPDASAELEKRKEEGLFCVLPRGKKILPAYLYPGEYRTLTTGMPEINVESRELGGSVVALTIRSPQYAHGVHLSLPEGAVPEDDWFDLLPGVSRSVQIRNLSSEDLGHVKVLPLKGGMIKKEAHSA